MFESGARAGVESENVINFGVGIGIEMGEYRECGYEVRAQAEHEGGLPN